MWINLVGALLVICGLLYMVREVLYRRQLSDPHGEGQPTLEPRQQGLRFLGLARNWPGLAMIMIGAVLLLIGGRL